MGLYGLSIDNLLRVNLVTAAGKLITLTLASPFLGLWWAICVAGANLGIVKSYHTIHNGIGWIGDLIYTLENSRL